MAALVSRAKDTLLSYKLVVHGTSSTAVAASTTAVAVGLISSFVALSTALSLATLDTLAVHKTVALSTRGACGLAVRAGEAPQVVGTSVSSTAALVGRAGDTGIADHLVSLCTCSAGTSVGETVVAVAGDVVADVSFRTALVCGTGDTAARCGVQLVAREAREAVCLVLNAVVAVSRGRGSSSVWAAFVRRAGDTCVSAELEAQGTACALVAARTGAASGTDVSSVSFLAALTRITVNTTTRRRELRAGFTGCTRALVLRTGLASRDLVLAAFGTALTCWTCNTTAFTEHISSSTALTNTSLRALSTMSSDLSFSACVQWVLVGLICERIGCCSCLESFHFS